ncbi:MAG: hypothetical protein ABW137_04310 [Mycobacterium sp.]
MRTLASITVAVVGASLLFGSLAATPIADADDPLAPIRAAVNGDRSQTRCPAYTYSRVLEDAAQAWARGGAYGVPGGPGGYDKTQVASGSGDPQAAAINAAYRDGAGGWISNCDYTEFGVGFVRDEGAENDVVAIVFGAPAKAAPPPAAVPPSAAAPPPAAVPPPAPPKVAPKDAVRVSFVKGFQWTVNVTSTADIAGKCTYVATNPLLPGANRSFDIGPRGSASFTVLAPPPFSTYHVVVSCTGPFNGATVEFGRVEQDVSA